MNFTVIMDRDANHMPDDLPDRSTATERDAYAWVMRFASGQATAADIAELKQWCARDPAHAEAFQRVSRTWQGLADLRRTAFAGDARPSPAVAASPRPGRRAFLGGAIAASLAGAAVLAARPPLGLWPSLSELAADYRTATGEQRRVVLADETSVEMNSQTSIAVRSGAGDAGGIELITGEAMFSVPPNLSGNLTVRAGDGRIVTSDARFNVRYQDQTVCVTCIAGNLRIEQRGNVLPVPAGRQALYSDRGMSSVVAVDPAQVTAWREGIVIFQLTPVSQVIAEINRYRSGRIILTNQELGRRLFNARLRIANIDHVVEQIEQVFGARATVLPGGIILLG